MVVKKQRDVKLSAQRKECGESGNIAKNGQHSYDHLITSCSFRSYLMAAGLSYSPR